MTTRVKKIIALVIASFVAVLDLTCVIFGAVAWGLFGNGNASLLSAFNVLTIVSVAFSACVGAGLIAISLLKKR